MGMSTHVFGIIDPDVRLDKMLALRAACDEMSTTYPDELVEYFGESEVGESDEYLRGKMTHVGIPKQKYQNEDSSGFDVRVADIPDDVVIIRFCNSW